MKYAVVDIETTGGVAKHHFITEVAVITIENGELVDRYETLINPDVLIPHQITMLTGITNEMVADAPTFEEVANEVWKRTADAVFVAHNVNFDYSFLRESFARINLQWRPKRLCTLRLSRKLIPGLASYSLGKIADQLGYEIHGRHRAMGDCEFTATLFKILLARDKDHVVAAALNVRSREATLPPYLNREQFDKVPAQQGVYIFKGAKGKVIYVGKAKNLRDRISDHFRGSTHTGLKNRFAEKIEDIDWITCPNELIALLTEANLIKKYWPPYNRLMKRVSLNWGVYAYLDQSGFQRFAVGKVGKWDKPEFSFRNQLEAQWMVEFLCQKHQLCAVYCGFMQEDCKTCDGNCARIDAQENYNARFLDALVELKQEGRTVLIKGKGFTEEEHSIVLIESGRYKGHGLVPSHIDLYAIDEVKNWLETGYDDQDIQTLIMSELSRQNADSELIVVA